MSAAPRDGTLVRLRLRDGTDFIGYYSTKWWGWVDYYDPVPLIRGDIRFIGWRPCDQLEPLIRREQGPPGAPVVAELVAVNNAEETQPPSSLAQPLARRDSVVVKPARAEHTREGLASRIVRARKPGRGR